MYPITLQALKNVKWNDKGSAWFHSVSLSTTVVCFYPQEKRQANKPCTLSASEGMDAYERSRYILKYTAHIAVLYTFSGSHYFSSSPALFRLHFRSTLQFFPLQVAFCIFTSKQKRRRGCRCWLINLLKQFLQPFCPAERVFFGITDA